MEWVWVTHYQILIYSNERDRKENKNGVRTRDSL